CRSSWCCTPSPPSAWPPPVSGWPPWSSGSPGSSPRCSTSPRSAGRGRRTSGGGRRTRRPARRSAVGHREQLPGALDALELAGAAVGQGDAGAGAQVADGPGHQDLAGVGLGQDPGGEVDGDAADVVAAQLDLAGVEPGPDLDVDVDELVAEGDRRAEGTPGRLEVGPGP